MYAKLELKALSELLPASQRPQTKEPPKPKERDIIDLGDIRKSVLEETSSRHWGKRTREESSGMDPEAQKLFDWGTGHLDRGKAGIKDNDRRQRYSRLSQQFLAALRSELESVTNPDHGYLNDVKGSIKSKRAQLERL